MDVFDFKLKDSNVHGKGIFTTKDIEKGATLFSTHMRTQTPGTYGQCCQTGEWVNLNPNYLYNHSRENANCASVTEGNFKVLVTLREIKEGEEILVDYYKDKDLEQPHADWIV